MMLLQNECLKCKSTNLVLINEEKLAETVFSTHVDEMFNLMRKCRSKYKFCGEVNLARGKRAN